MPTKIKDINLYSTLEISQKLNVTPNTIWKYLKQGKLKGQKVLGRWFISGEEIINFFKDSN
jgi:DNA-directed RNA polymerase specialized sigma24 family protein